MHEKSKSNAQQRADQIGYFRNELEMIEQENIITLTQGQRSAITNYHEHLLDDFSKTFDIDSTLEEKQLSFGMKIASFLGALGLAASVFFLFYQFWGRFSTPLQVAVLITSPLFCLGLTIIISHREKTGYFSKLTGMVCMACFVLNIFMLGRIFNLTPSPNAFLALAGFGFVLAYASGSRLALAAAIICFSSFLSAQAGTWSGCYWIHFGERPENFFPAAAFLFMIPFFPHTKFSDFAVIYRVFALILFFIPVLILSNWGMISYLTLPGDSIEVMYQITGFIVSSLVIFIGIKNNWPEVANTGNVFFVVFLYTKFYDWWWDWMPKYLFFLVIGLTAILILIIFKYFRNSAIRNAKGLLV